MESVKCFFHKYLQRSRFPSVSNRYLTSDFVLKRGLETCGSYFKMLIYVYHIAVGDKISTLGQETSK